MTRPVAPRTEHGNWCVQTIRPTEHGDALSEFLHNDRCRDIRATALPSPEPSAATTFWSEPDPELRIEEGPVVIVQTPTDPGDIGEPRVVEADGVTYVFVPDFVLWPPEENL
jgi:hypothetical protein